MHEMGINLFLILCTSRWLPLRFALLFDIIKSAKKFKHDKKKKNKWNKTGDSVGSCNMILIYEGFCSEKNHTFQRAEISFMRAFQHGFEHLSC